MRGQTGQRLFWRLDVPSPWTIPPNARPLSPHFSPASLGQRLSQSRQRELVPPPLRGHPSIPSTRPSLPPSLPSPSLLGHPLGQPTQAQGQAPAALLRPPRSLCLACPSCFGTHAPPNAPKEGRARFAGSPATNRRTNRAWSTPATWGDRLSTLLRRQILTSDVSLPLSLLPALLWVEGCSTLNSVQDPSLPSS